MEIKTIKDMNFFIENNFKKLNLNSLKIKSKVKKVLEKHKKELFNKTKLIKELKIEFNFSYFSILQKEFYIERGWTLAEAENFISEYQKENSKKSAEKNNFKGRFSKEWFKERYPENWEKLYKEKNQKSIISKEKYIKEFGKEEGLKKFQTITEKRNYSLSKEGYIEKYGKKIGLEKYNSKIEKHKNSVSKEYFIKKYGKKEGEKIWDNRNKNISYKNSFKYYEEKYGEKGFEILSKKRNRTEEEFIKLYGAEKGKIKWNSYMKKLEERSPCPYSKVSISLFSSLKIKDSFYGKKEKQIFIKNGRYIKPDFLYKNKIIEFYGDLWHANPKIFKENEIYAPFALKNKTAKEKWLEDEIRVNTLIKMGYEVLIIWEKEYIKDKESTIKKCLKFIEGETK